MPVCFEKWCHPLNGPSLPVHVHTPSPLFLVAAEESGQCWPPPGTRQTPANYSPCWHWGLGVLHSKVACGGGALFTLSVCAVSGVCGWVSRWLGEGLWGATCFFSDTIESEESSSSWKTHSHKHIYRCFRKTETNLSSHFSQYKCLQTISNTF